MAPRTIFKLLVTPPDPSEASSTRPDRTSGPSTTRRRRREEIGNRHTAAVAPPVPKNGSDLSARLRGPRDVDGTPFVFTLEDEHRAVTRFQHRVEGGRRSGIEVRRGPRSRAQTGSSCSARGAAEQTVAAHASVIHASVDRRAGSARRHSSRVGGEDRPNRSSTRAGIDSWDRADPRQAEPIEKGERQVFRVSRPQLLVTYVPVACDV
jgi:hypothetical protein